MSTWAQASLATEKQPIACAGHPLCSRQVRVIDLPRTVAIQCNVGANKAFDCIAPITAACGPVQQEEVGREMLAVVVRLGDRSRAEHPEGVRAKASRVKLLVREDHLEHRAIRCRIQTVVTAALRLPHATERKAVRL